MDNINDIVKKLDLTQFSESPKVQNIEDERTRRIINRIFERLEGILNGFWWNIKSQAHLNNIKTQWLELFRQLNFTDVRLIEIGINVARRNEQQSLPKASEFIRWCTPSPDSLGLPSIKKAFDEAVYNSHETIIDKRWSHPVVYHAWSQSTPSKLRNLNSDDSFKLFKYNYEQAIKDFIAGKPFSEPPKAIESKEPDNVAGEFKQYNSRQSAVAAMMKKLKG